MRRRAERLTETTLFFYQKRHSQSPGRVHFQMTVHEPHTWIIGFEPQSCPTAFRYTDCIMHRRIGEIEQRRICIGVVVSKSSTDYEEIVAMDVNGMIFESHNARILQNQLHVCVVRNAINPGAELWIHVDGEIASRVVELQRWLAGKIPGENSAIVVVGGLEKRSLGKNKGLVVYGCRKSPPIVAFTRLTRWTIL